jgi:hypothetical protein
MRKYIKMALAVSGLLTGASSWADTIVIDFNDLPGGTFNTPLLEDGFLIDPALAPFQPAIDPTGAGDGSNDLAFCGWCSDTSEGVSIYSNSGLTFELDSLDVYSDGLGVQDYEGAGLVTGYLDGGGSVTQGISATVGISTVLFDSSWANLTSIDIVFDTSSFNTFGIVPAIDNITLQAVPIPAAVWLFGSALAGLGWMRRRKTA